MMNINKIKVKRIAIVGVLLAICIISQFFKNTSVFITGPIINLCLILCTLESGILSGIILSIITPITSYFITGSPIIMAIPPILPMIMIGNILLCDVLYILYIRMKRNLLLSLIVGSIIKSVFIGLTISVLLISMFLPDQMMAKRELFQFTFSIVQLITSIIASIIAYIIYKPIHNSIKNI